MFYRFTTLERRGVGPVVYVIEGVTLNSAWETLVQRIGRATAYNYVEDVVGRPSPILSSYWGWVVNLLNDPPRADLELFVVLFANGSEYKYSATDIKRAPMSVVVMPNGELKERNVVITDWNVITEFDWEYESGSPYRTVVAWKNGTLLKGGVLSRYQAA